MKRETWLAGVIVCGAVIALGAFLPWASVGVFSVNGLSGDGIFAIGIGGAMVVAGVAGYGGSNPATYGVQILGGLALALAVYEAVSRPGFNPTGATGLIVIGAAGGIAAAVFGTNPPKT